MFQFILLCSRSFEPSKKLQRQAKYRNDEDGCDHATHGEQWGHRQTFAFPYARNRRALCQYRQMVLTS